MGASHAAIGIMFQNPFEKIRNIKPMKSQIYDQYSDFIFELCRYIISSSYSLLTLVKFNFYHI